MEPNTDWKREHEELGCASCKYANKKMLNRGPCCLAMPEKRLLAAIFKEDEEYKCGNIGKNMEKEFANWESASDEDLCKFEAELEENGNG